MPPDACIIMEQLFGALDVHMKPISKPRGGISLICSESLRRLKECRRRELRNKKGGEVRGQRLKLKMEIINCYERNQECGIQ